MSSLDRVFDVLDLFSETRPVWTIDAATAALGHSKSTVYRYFRALVEHLLKQVYMKLHVKLPNLKEAKNGLILTIPEAAAFNMVFADQEYQASNMFSLAILTNITGQIDQKLA